MAANKDGTAELDKRGPGVGALLRASRLRFGEELRDVAEALCIRYLYLDAIEAGRYHELPGNTYAVGFIRAYADHLGLDSEEVVRRYKAEQAGTKRHDDLIFPTPVPERGVPRGAIVFVGLFIAIVAYGAWYYASTREDGIGDLVAPLPERLAALLNGDNPSQPPAQPAGPTSEATAPKPAEAAQGVTEAIVAAVPESSTETVAMPAPAEASQPASTLAPEAAATPAPTDTDVAETAVSAAASQSSEQAAVANVPTSTPERDTASATAPVVAATPAPVPEPVITPQTAAAETTTAPSVTQEAPSSEPVPTAAVATPEPSAAPASESTNASTSNTPPVTTEATTETATTEAATTETATTDVTSTETPAPTTTEAADTSRIVFRASANIWIQVLDSVGNEVVTRLLLAGDSYTVPDRDGLRLYTSNAGGLEILVDGDAVPALGQEGDVVRGATMDAAKLKAGEALP